MEKRTPLESIKNTFQETNVEVLRVIQELSDEQLRWQPDPSSHSGAFIMWHIARWTDHLQATIPGMTVELARRLPAGQQVWERDSFAVRWGFDSSQLGYEMTGTDMDIEEIGEPNWPGKEVLLGYARQVFSAAEQAISAIDEEQFQELELQQYEDDYIEASRAKSATVGNAVMDHLVHNVHHLGELYYLLGLLKFAESNT